MVKNLFGLYMILPLICAFLGHIIIGFKNKITLRVIACTLCTLNFFVFLAMYFLNFEESFSIFNFSFVINKINLLFLLFNSIIFIIFGILSKTFIQRFSKIFYSNLILLNGMTNCFLLSDSVSLCFLALFIIFLLNYLSISTYLSKKEFKKEAKIRFIYDFLILFFASFLIMYDFARYFMLNGIELTYSSIKPFLPYVSQNAQMFAFLGFGILALRLFNFFSAYITASQVKKSENCVVCLNVFSTLILGGYYFINFYKNFDFLIFKFENVIALFLVFCALYCAFLAFRKDNILKSVLFLMFSNIPFLIFAIFTFDEFVKYIFVYGYLAFIFAYLLLCIHFIILGKKIKTLDFDKIKCALVKNKSSQIMTLYTLLNVAFVPFSSLFGVILLLGAHMVTTDYESAFLNYFVYIMLFSIFITCLGVFNLVYKIYTEPSKKPAIEISYPYHQRFCLSLIVFLNILFGIFGYNLLVNMLG